MLKQIKQFVPDTIKRKAIEQLAFLQNELLYLELHLTDHCNLNCKGCFHYCPLASPHYTDLAKYETDMQRLRQLFRNISRIRLMGGEPLLHPDSASFITIARTNFPRTDLRLVTNGILLPQAPASFWETCRTTNTTIEVSVYPALKKFVTGLSSICAKEGVNLYLDEMNTFFAHMNFKGDSDKKRAFHLCRSRFFTPFLQNGRLYVCAMPALIHYFNTRFSTQILADQGIDIHSPNMTGQKILKYLNKPIETCKWCSYDFVPHSWLVNDKKLPILQKDWDALT
jgi:organic radical activating enzyme